MLDAFARADDVLCSATRGISSLITETGVVNLDFADVRSVMRNGGAALMGSGIATGPNAAEDAARMAIHSPLLDDVSIEGATSILVNITGPRSLGIRQISQAATLINAEAGAGAHVFLGTVIDECDAGGRGARHRDRDRLLPTPALPPHSMRAAAPRLLWLRARSADRTGSCASRDAGRVARGVRARRDAAATARVRTGAGHRAGAALPAPVARQAALRRLRKRNGSRVLIAQQARGRRKRAVISFPEILARGDSVIEFALEPDEADEPVIMDNGSIRSFNTEAFRVPTFVRKQMD